MRLRAAAPMLPPAVVLLSLPSLPGRAARTALSNLVDRYRLVWVNPWRSGWSPNRRTDPYSPTLRGTRACCSGRLSASEDRNQYTGSTLCQSHSGPRTGAWSKLLESRASGPERPGRDWPSCGTQHRPSDALPRKRPCWIRRDLRRDASARKRREGTTSRIRSNARLSLRRDHMCRAPHERCSVTDASPIEDRP